MAAAEKALAEQKLKGRAMRDSIDELHHRETCSLVM